MDAPGLSRGETNGTSNAMILSRNMEVFWISERLVCKSPYEIDGMEW